MIIYREIVKTLRDVFYQFLSVAGQDCRLYFSMTDAMNDWSHWIAFSIILSPFLHN